MRVFSLVLVWFCMILVCVVNTSSRHGSVSGTGWHCSPLGREFSRSCAKTHEIFRRSLLCEPDLLMCMRGTKTNRKMCTVKRALVYALYTNCHYCGINRRLLRNIGIGKKTAHVCCCAIANIRRGFVRVRMYTWKETL